MKGDAAQYAGKQRAFGPHEVSLRLYSPRVVLTAVVLPHMGRYTPPTMLVNALYIDLNHI